MAEIDIDITSDLGEADDASLGDSPVLNTGNDNIQQGSDGAVQKRPDGVVSANEATRKPAEELGLRDQLSNAFKGEEPAGATDKPVEAPALTKDGEGKYRQADGTFASAEHIAAFEAAQKAPEAKTTNADEAPTYVRSMTPVEQQQFQALPAELRQYVGRTMEALEGQSARFTEYGLLENQLIGPRREAWAQNGLTPAVALNQLFSLSDFATRAPKDFVLWFAEQHKIDLDAALDERDQLNSADPQVRALQGQVQQLQQLVNQSQNGHVQQQHDVQVQEVNTFVQEKDGAGALKRPYLTDVMSTWPAQIQAIRLANPSMPNGEVLQKAYDAACWADPNVRAKMQDAVRQQAIRDAQARTQAAKSAGSSVNGSPSGQSPSVAANNNNLGIRETLQAAFNEHRS
jgi:hypothetical protein